MRVNYLFFFYKFLLDIVLILPASMYIVLVTIQADTCFCMMPNNPVMRAVRRHRRHTILQEHAEFIIPAKNSEFFFFYSA